jgi:hypothetical protein
VALKKSNLRFLRCGHDTKAGLVCRGLFIRNESFFSLIYKIMATLQTALWRRVWIGWRLLNSTGLGMGGREEIMKDEL